MLNKAYHPGLEFIKITQETYIPALQSGDKAAAERNLLTMKASYQQHRKAIDEVVVLANAMSSSLETEVLAAMTKSNFLYVMTVLCFLTLVSWVSWLILGNITSKLGGEPGEALDCVRRLASGDFSWRNKHLGNQVNLLSELDTLVDKLRFFNADMLQVQNDHTLGNIEATIDSSHYEGGYLEMAENVNKLITSQMAKQHAVVECFRAFGMGDFEASLQQFPGKVAYINAIIEQVRTNFKCLIEDTELLSRAAASGNL